MAPGIIYPTSQLRHFRSANRSSARVISFLPMGTARDGTLGTLVPSASGPDSAFVTLQTLGFSNVPVVVFGRVCRDSECSRDSRCMHRRTMAHRARRAHDRLSRSAEVAIGSHLRYRSDDVRCPKRTVRHPVSSVRGDILVDSPTAVVSIYSLAPEHVFGAVQMLVMLHHHEQRHAGPLGATLRRFTQFLGGDVFLGLFVSGAALGMVHRFVYSVLAMILGLGLCALCFRYASAEVRMFIIYCFTVFAATMRSPIAGPTTVPLWLLILLQPDNRYLFYPALPLLLAVIWCAVSGPQRGIRAVGIALTAALFIRAGQGFRYRPLPDMDFPQQAKALKSAPAGARMIIPINPPGWSMVLIKK